MWEASVEAQIRSAQERGEFDGLPGAGRPIPGRGLPYDESWWIKSFMEREKLPTDLLLPTPLLLRRRIERLPDEVRDLPTEQAVRSCVADLNAEVMAWLRNPSGPRVVVRPVDADAVVSTWRAARQAAAPASAPVVAPRPPAPRWSWFPFRRRRAA
ncbi:DnaJ family domain-containing protein [Micromonospora sp. NPDC003241]